MRMTTLPAPKRREFLPNRFKMTVWSKLRPYYDALLRREINSVEELKAWLLNRSELEAFTSEAFAWRYLRLSADSRDKDALASYQYAVQELSPRIVAYDNKLNNKLVNSPYAQLLPTQQYGVYLRSVRNQVALYRDENVDLHTQVQLRSREHGKIFADMTVALNGMQMTLQKASALLEEPDRGRREAIYHKINGRIQQDIASLEELFDDLLGKRTQIAHNAGFDNFRDYCFRSLGRFDYDVKDCLNFHDAIRQEILPLVDQLNAHRAQALGLNKLRPWDLQVDISSEAPLRPFRDMDELIDKTASCLGQLHPGFGETLALMREMGHLDLDSRPGKRPGGYNMPLQMTGVPFIFMNASNSFGDLRTLLHESGHAIHSYLTRDIPLSAARRAPSEVAELAAMTMELLTMDHWQVFFPDEASLRRARLQQLDHVLKVLPWIATIDKFQHWLYTHPEHTREERRATWLRIFREFNSSWIDHTGLEHYAANLWHKQLHLFEVPFYYIEYGMAQLGAIAIWKNYREDPQQAIKQYRAALKLGYTRPIGEIYAAAGIRFDFSGDYVRELGQFVKGEIDKLV